MEYAQAVPLTRGDMTTHHQFNTILIAIIQEARCSTQQWLLQQALQPSLTKMCNTSK
jgi:hypothetical protein